MDELCRMSLVEARKKLGEKKVSSVELTKACLKRIEETKDLNTLVTVCADKALAAAEQADKNLAEGKEGALTGVPIVVKDNISTKGIRTTCASKMLSNYVPPFDATVVEKLKAAGAVIIGKANMDEFAMGSSNETSYFGPVKNALDKTKVPGGSSGGSASSVAAFQCYGALGSDTGGSIRQPASFCGVVGLKPTYSAVSRYGLIAFASSLDQIGPLTRTVEDNAVLYDVIRGKDCKDSTSAQTESSPTLGEYSVKGKVLGVAKEFFSVKINAEVKEIVQNAIKKYEKMGAVIKEVSIKSFDAALATYYILACAEACSNLARFDGIKYGLRVPADNYIDIYYNTRTEGFGAEVKRRIMIGNYVLSSGYYDAYYLKALKIRTMIKADFDKAFEGCDAIIGPTSPSVAFGLGTDKIPSESYLADIYTVPVNIAGIPAISIPCGNDSKGLPAGLQIIGRAFGEKEIFGLARAFEREA